MWRHIKPLLVGFGVSVAIFVVCAVAWQLAYPSVSNELVGRWGMEAYMSIAVLMLFFPAFAAGYVSKGSGMLYGVVLAGVPIVLFSLVNTGVPSAFYLMWLAVAAVGGHVGQLVGAKRHAS